MGTGDPASLNSDRPQDRMTRTQTERQVDQAAVSQGHRYTEEPVYATSFRRQTDRQTDTHTE